MQMQNVKMIVNAYDAFHPLHMEMMNLADDTGLDIELLPDFEVEIEVPEALTKRFRSLKRAAEEDNDVDAYEDAKSSILHFYLETQNFSSEELKKFVELYEQGKCVFS